MRISIVSLLAFLLAGLPVLGQSTAPASTAPTTRALQRATVISLSGTIDDYNRDALFKRFAEARQTGSETIILKLDTPGGLVTAGLDISRFLKQQHDLHIIALVHEKAYSAGIMIGLACNEIVMEPGSYIGDSAPIVMDSSGGLQKLDGAERAKAESPILADFHDSAIQNGYDPLLAEAMVSYGRVVRWVEYVGPARLATTTTVPADVLADAARTIVSAGPHPGERRFVNDVQFAAMTQAGWREVVVAGVPNPIDGPDTLLTVSADVAYKIGLAKAIVASPEQLANDRGYLIVANLAPGGGEKMIALLSGAAVRGLLLTIFMLSLYAALHTPGTGGAEAIAMISLGLLLGVPLLTGYAQWWEIAAIVIGLCLLALEIFVIPGFGVAGISGLVLVIGGLVMTFVGNTGLPGTWELPQMWTGVQNGLLVIIVAFVVSGLLALWLRRYLPSLPYFNRLVLQTPILAGAGTGGSIVASDTWPFVGTIGRATTDLKPGGAAEFPYADDRRLTAVVSDSGFISAGAKLIVLEVHGNRVVVRPVEEGRSQK